MIKSLLLSIMVFSEALDSPLFAARKSFECTVNSSYDLSVDGEMVEQENPLLQKGDTFVVDRKTGRILSDNNALSNFSAIDDPQVLNSGDEMNSFKVLTVYEPLNPVSVLEVRTWINYRVPPFMYLHLGHLYLGTCNILGLSR